MPTSFAYLRRLATGLLLIICVVLVPSLARGQLFKEVNYRTIGTSAGLPHATVYSLLEDDSGWIWVGTPNGLFRYDGVNFIAYPAKLAFQKDIHDLNYGPDGRIYAQNFRGQLFCVSSDSLRLVLQLQLPPKHFMSFAFANDTLLVAADKQLYRFALNQEFLATERIIDTLDIPQNSTLIATGLSTAVLRSPNQALRRFGTSAKSSINSNNQLTFAETDSELLQNSCIQNSRAWLLNQRTEHGNVICEIMQADASGKFELLASFKETADKYVPQKRITQQLTDGTFVIGSSTGLFKVEATTDTLLPILSGKAVNCMITDRTGTLWLGTAEQGLVLVDDVGVTLQKFDGISGPIVDFIEADSSGQLLYALTTDGALYRFNDGTQKLADRNYNRHFWRGNDDSIFVGHTVIYPSLRKDYKNGLRQDISAFKGATQLPDGALAIATSARAMLTFPYGDSRRTMQRGDYQNFALETTYSSAINRPAEVQAFRSVRTTDVSYDAAEGILYVACVDGVAAYNLRQKSISDHQLQGTLGTIEKLHVAGGKALLALADGGCWWYDTQRDVRLQLLDERVLVNRIQATATHLWLQTNRGIYRAKLQVDNAPAFEHLGIAHGLRKEPPTAFYATRRWGYATYGKEVIRIQANQLARRINPNTDEQKIPNSIGIVYYARIEVNGIEKNFEGDKPIVLEANKQALRIVPRIADYTTSPYADFEFRLVNLDSTWQTLGGTNPSVYLPGLRAGEHRLEVRLADRPDTTSTRLIVARVPFWRKPWPYVIAILLVAGLLMFQVKQRAQRLQYAAETQSALRQSQLTALAAQMNPHFVFNALNSVQDFMMSNDKLAANAYLSKFAMLIRLTLENSREPLIKLSQELAVMRTYIDLERVRFDNAIDITLEVDSTLSLSAKLPALLVQPYVENAFKHGLLHRHGTKRLIVKYVKGLAGQMIVTIEDNGVGRARAATVDSAERRGAGFASGATVRRLKLLNEQYNEAYSVHIEDLKDQGVAIGTRVTMQLRLLPDNAPTLVSNNQAR